MSVDPHASLSRWEHWWQAVAKFEPTGKEYLTHNVAYMYTRVSQNLCREWEPMGKIIKPGGKHVVAERFVSQQILPCEWSNVSYIKENSVHALYPSSKTSRNNTSDHNSGTLLAAPAMPKSLGQRGHCARGFRPRRGRDLLGPCLGDLHIKVGRQCS